VAAMQACAYTTSDGSTSTAYAWIYERLFASWAGAWNGSLAFAVANVLFWGGVLAIPYRHRIFLKV
jgi:predicted acyltransferase